MHSHWDLQHEAMVRQSIVPISGCPETADMAQEERVSTSEAEGSD